MVKKLLVLGSTGALGNKTLDVVREFSDRFIIIGLGARQNVERLVKQVEEFRPKYVLLTENTITSSLERTIKRLRIEYFYGIEGLKEIATIEEVDLVVLVMGGALGIYPLWEAINHGKDVAIANKESIVIMGELIRKRVEEKNVRLIPIDSEPSAIFQCLNGLMSKNELESVILTASGGPFRNLSREELKAVTPEQALHHPVWRMGKKITVDSATLMNKGFEWIEIHKFFNIPYEKIHIVVHPQGVIHGAINLKDSTSIALMSVPDMRIPILYALSYPERIETNWQRLDLLSLGEITFEPPDVEKFPALRIAMESGRKGLTYPVVLNASDEVAVELFLRGEINFTDIPKLVEEVLSSHSPMFPDSIEAVMAVDRWAREETLRVKDRVR
ncbi:MAG: 1-deoxy-D-xylulose-5-phosphate reductoisomerase [bacterium]